MDASREMSSACKGGFTARELNLPLNAMLFALETSTAGTAGTKLSLSKS